MIDPLLHKGFNLNDATASLIFCWLRNREESYLLNIENTLKQLLFVPFEVHLLIFVLNSKNTFIMHFS